MLKAIEIYLSVEKRCDSHLDCDVSIQSPKIMNSQQFNGVVSGSVRLSGHDVEPEQVNVNSAVS